MFAYTPQFQEYLKTSVWWGGPCGLPSADQYAINLREMQIANAGLAQVVARFEEKKRRQRESGHYVAECDSDDEDPYFADMVPDCFVNIIESAQVDMLSDERQEWLDEYFPFQKAANKVKHNLYFKATLCMPVTIGCWTVYTISSCLGLQLFCNVIKRMIDKHLRLFILFCIHRVYPSECFWSAVPSMMHRQGHCGTTALPLHYHCVTTALPLRHHCITTASPLHYHRVNTALPLR